MSGFNSWIDTFVDEKDLDLEHRFEVEGPEWGWNSIPLSEVIATAKQCSPGEQDQIKSKLVEIDYRNGDAMHFFEYLAKGHGAVTAPEDVLTTDQLAAVHRVRAEIIANGELNSAGGPSCGVLSEELGILLGATESYGMYRVDDGSLCDDHAWVELPGGVILDASADQFDGGAPVRVLCPGDPDYNRYV